MAITASQIEKAVNNQIMLDGSFIEGFVRINESDQYLYPDLDSFVILPWRPQHGKVAQGQHEIDFKYAPALECADKIMTFKLAVKTVAQPSSTRGCSWWANSASSIATCKARSMTLPSP